MPSCSYDLEFADSRVEDRGFASSDEILRAFDDFDWSSEVEAANRLGLCAPTFRVHDPEHQRVFWVSAAGEPADFEFVNDYSFPGPERTFLGFRQHPRIECAATHDLTHREARECIELFLRGDHDALLKRLESP